jgi:hypothetical protein
MNCQLFADILRVCWGDCFIQLAFRHPINSHRVTGGSNAAISTAIDRDKINHVVGFSVLRLPLIEGVAPWMFAVRRHDNGKIRLK